jgi:hypothetical protein
MTKQRPISAALAIAAGLVLAGADTLLANGEQFFIPAGGRKVELAYFARVKDAQTGRPLRVTPYVSIVDPLTGVYIPFQGDEPGHFRSPDVGAAIKEVSSAPIDTKQLEVTITATGYQTLKIANIPRQSKGMVELNVRMEPKANAGNTASAANTPAGRSDVASGAAAAGSDTPVDSARPTFFLLAGCLGLAVISGVVRTVGRRESTAR